MLCVVTGRQSLIYWNLETLWRDTLVKNPEAAIAHNNLAAILVDRGHLAEAMAHLRESVRIDPLPESHGNLAILLAKQEMFDEALKHFYESLRLEPRSAVRAEFARLLVRLGRYEEALPEFRQAIELTPLDPDLRLQLAELLISLRRVHDALVELNAIVELAPDHPRLWFTVGVLWLESDPIRAVAAFERSAKLSPQTPGTFYRLGLARERIGDRTGASVALRQALKIQPNWLEAQQALRRVSVAITH